MTKLEQYRHQMLELAALRDGLVQRANEIQRQMVLLEGRILELEEQQPKPEPGPEGLSMAVGEDTTTWRFPGISKRS